MPTLPLMDGTELAIRRGLRRLPKVQRECLELRYFKELTTREMGTVLRMRENAARILLLRSLYALMKHVGAGGASRPEGGSRPGGPGNAPQGAHVRPRPGSLGAAAQPPDDEFPALAQAIASLTRLLAERSVAPAQAKSGLLARLSPARARRGSQGGGGGAQQ